MVQEDVTVCLFIPLLLCLQYNLTNTGSFKLAKYWQYTNSIQMFSPASDCFYLYLTVITQTLTVSGFL